MVHEIGEDAEFVTREFDGGAVDCDARASRIEYEPAAPEFGPDLSGGAADERPQPREQLLHLKGLRDVVVRALIDTADLLVPAAAGRQHQNRCRNTCLPPVGEQCESVNLR